MDVAILSSALGWHSADLIRAFEARGHTAQLRPIDTLKADIGPRSRLEVRGADLRACDAVVLRTIPRGSLEQVIFRIDVLHRLERLGVPVVNPARVIERTVDKFYTSALLEEAGIRTPRTVVAEKFDDAMQAFRQMGDVIVKPLFGSNGRGMARVSDEEVAYRVFRALELERAVYYVQETVPHDGQDLRVFVVGRRIVAAVSRSANGWRTNLSRGGRAAPVSLPAEWAEVALAAADVVGAEYAGVDLLPTLDGEIQVLEVNGSAGWRWIQPLLEVDIADEIVAHVETLVRRRRRPHRRFRSKGVGLGSS